MAFFYLSKLILIYHLIYKAMTVKVVITYYAHQGDWDIEEVLDGRKISDEDAKEDLIQMFKEDPEFIISKADISISEAKDSI